MPQERIVAIDVADLVARTREFLDTLVLPVEDRFDGDVTGAGGDDIRRELQRGARDRGLLSPHAPREHGGLGLSMSQRARGRRRSTWHPWSRER